MLLLMCMHSHSKLMETSNIYNTFYIMFTLIWFNPYGLFNIIIIPPSPLNFVATSNDLPVLIDDCNLI